MTDTRLETELTSVGCGRKLPPRVLKELLHDSDVDGMLVRHMGDDCGVTGAGPLKSLHTVDIVLPMGLDPETWGRIVALHCVSDVYAAGGVPEVAVGIVQLSQEWIRNGWHVSAYKAAVRELRECGVDVVGGHTMRNQVTSMGFSITGAGLEDHLRARRNVQVGDVLVLTKPVGSGLILGARAFDRTSVTAEELAEVVRSMLVSNALADELAHKFGVRASTDVTGFGLLGSCLEIADEAGVVVSLSLGTIPKFLGVDRALKTANVSPLAETIMVDSEPHVSWEETPIEDRLLLCDPQVSGGLLLAMPEDVAEAYTAAMVERDARSWVIGKVEARSEGTRHKVSVSPSFMEQ
ncbi:selenide, water dikinase SelD [Lentzea sp. NBRC 102530]|uniref:selenide, water dikinase SelD n=1 Tax=Lentzea sp. NBRC 102530 TaxID=3032201 RepID=UPI0024A0859F|nr:selenide, water dikinase SelD [Lentzea sp. NBRC 102530]GLY50180.1 selenide, water dikinase [Lentzea sp. NBRC 102530]